MKLAFVLGTRPEIIKMAPLIQEAYKRGISPTVINTGQHRELLYPLWDFFGIKAHYNLDIMREGQDLSNTFARAISSISQVLEHHNPDWTFVQGDTTTTFAGATAAYYNKIKVAHIEAGMRTHDLFSPYPEEGNRQMVSRIANLHFCATPSNRDSLVSEGIDQDAIHVVGNTGLDSMAYVKPSDVEAKKWKTILLTLHRRESFGKGIQNILTAINYLADYGGIKIIFPMHPNPNVREAVAKFLKPSEAINICNPLEYPDFVNKMREADVILSDSGGVQEEAPFLGKPVVVLREKTERTETIGKSSFLAGFDAATIINKTVSLLTEGKIFQPDFVYGDGKSSQRILDIINK